jgi:hypothetical protein
MLSNTNLVITSCLSGALFSGGTADITVHEKLSNGRLKELCRASGDDCGGTSVDNAFYRIFVKLVGAPMVIFFRCSTFHFIHSIE